MASTQWRQQIQIGKVKIGYFRPTSETVQDGDIVTMSYNAISHDLE